MTMKKAAALFNVIKNRETGKTYHIPVRAPRKKTKGSKYA